VGCISGTYRCKSSPPSAGGAIAASWNEVMGTLADDQHGVVAMFQLRELGVPRHVVEARIGARWLRQVHQGVYAVGHLALARDAREHAAVLACGPHALLSHRSVAARLGILRTSSPRIEVTAPRSRRPQAGILVHRSRLIHPDDRTRADGIPVTSVARTVVDLADVESDRRLGAALNELERRNELDLAAIHATLERLSGRRGRRRLLRVLATHEPETAFTRSRLERRFLHLCAAHGLPVPAANLWIGDQELDFYWSDALLGVELDTRAFHATAHAFDNDRRRDRRMATRSIHIIRITPRDLRDEAALAAELRQIRVERLRLLAGYMRSSAAAAAL
jgi:predicted transcriptional regulator of viral defense system